MVVQTRPSTKTFVSPARQLPGPARQLAAYRMPATAGQEYELSITIRQFPHPPIARSFPSLPTFFIQLASS